MARHSIPDIIERPEPRSGHVTVPPRPLVLSLVRSLRPEQWTKNLILFGGVLFGQRLLDLRSVLYASAAFAVFCALSGVVYLLNDVADRDADRRHPLKKHRPIASGALSTSVAVGASVAIGVLALACAFLLRIEFGLVAAAYVALLAFYSGPLKHVVIIDVPISNWLLFVTILGALFLALSKRRHELVLLAGGATSHRPILQEYTPYL